MDTFVWCNEGCSAGANRNTTHSNVEVSLCQVEQLFCFLSHSLTVVSQRGRSYKGKDGKESGWCAKLHRIRFLAKHEILGLIAGLHGHANGFRLH